MEQKSISYLTVMMCVILLGSVQFSKLLAQDNSNVKEPPIPVYIVCPYHEDSLRAAYEASIQGNGSLSSNAIKQLDTLHLQIQRSSAENTVHFIWLYMLIALLGIINIILLFSTASIKKELAQIKHLEHQQMLLASESSTMPQSLPQIQEVLFDQESAKTQANVRAHKAHKAKSRIKNHK
jgi:hypothetical protein